MPSPSVAVLLGATSPVGSYLRERLAAAGFTGECVSRRPPPAGHSEDGFRWRRLDIRDPGTWTVAPGAVCLSLLPIWLLPSCLPQLGPARQIVAVSSTSLFTKAASTDPREAALAARIAAAEEDLRKGLQGSGCTWTVLRPTLIYDPGRDRNVSEIARFADRFRFFPVLRPASGLRQPIHAEDVAQAVFAAMDNPAARNRALNLPGGETLPYREMVRRIFAGLGRRPVILPLPGSLLHLAFALAQSVYGDRYSAALLGRMNQDLVFDGTEARQALRIDPRPFHPRFAWRRR